MPFDLYYHFVLEERFGFNKMTLRTFFADLAKNFALAIVLEVSARVRAHLSIRVGFSLHLFACLRTITE